MTLLRPMTTKKAIGLGLAVFAAALYGLYEAYQHVHGGEDALVAIMSGKSSLTLQNIEFYGQGKHIRCDDAEVMEYFGAMLRIAKKRYSSQNNSGPNFDLKMRFSNGQIVLLAAEPYLNVHGIQLTVAESLFDWETSDFQVPFNEPLPVKVQALMKELISH